MGTFRHPLRNDWDNLKDRFAQAALGADQEAMTARAMLAMMPPFLDVIEAQRDQALTPDQKATAMFAVIGMLLENTIEAAWRTPNGRVQACDVLLARLARTVKPRLAKAPAISKSNGLILPGQF